MVKDILLLLFSCSVYAWAQGDASFPLNYHPVRKGKVEIKLHPATPTPSLDALVWRSRLIFQGRVLTTLTPIQRDMSETIETPIVVAVDRLFKGVIEGNPGVMTMFQVGGSLGDIETIVPEVPLMKPGEQYIFFLQPEMRILKPGESPRYYITGSWAGLVKIVDGKVKMTPGASQINIADDVSDLLTRHENANLDEFLKDVDDVVHMRGPKVNVKKSESRADIPWPAPTDQHK